MGEDHDREPRCAETRTRRYGGERLPYEPGSTESVVGTPRKGVAPAGSAPVTRFLTVVQTS